MNAKLAKLQAKIRNYNNLAAKVKSRSLKVKFLVLALRCERQIELLQQAPKFNSNNWEFAIDTMLGKGKPGWVAKIEFSQKSERRFGAEYRFIPPTERSGCSFGRERLFYSIPQKDGIYVVHDGNFGSRSSDEQVHLVEDGKRRPVASLADAICLYFHDKDLPQLEGSRKQVDWAERIRLEFLAECLGRNLKIPGFIKQEVSAKWWIEKREKVSAGAVLAAVKSAVSN